MYATWLRPVCWLVGHTPARWRHREDGILACGWHCLLCGYARARVRVAVTTPDADLRLRSALEQFQAKLGRDRSLTWETCEVDDEESAP